MIGAAVAIGGGLYAMTEGYWSLPQAGGADGLGARVEQLEQTVAGIEGQAATIEPLVGRIEALEGASQGAGDDLVARIEALEAAPAATPDEDLSARLDALAATDETLAGQIAALESDAGSGPGASTGSEAVAELEARIAALEESVAGRQDGGATTAAATAEGGTDDRLSTIETDLAGLAAAVASLQESGVEAAADGDASGAVAGMVSRVEALEAELERARTATAEQLAALDQRLSQVDQMSADVERIAADLGSTGQQTASTLGRTEVLSGEITALGIQLGTIGEQVSVLGRQVDTVDQRAATLASSVDELGTRVATTEEQIASRDDAADKTAGLALVVGQLEGAVYRAQPYERQLEHLRGLSAGDPLIEEAVVKLEPSAASGVPSMADLRGSLAATASGVIQSARAPDGDNLLDRAAGNLLNLVTVRSVGADVQGDDPEARVARAEAKLAEGDLGGAVAELEAIEGPAADVAAGWLAPAKARLDAEDALASLQTRSAELLTEMP